MVKPSSVPVPAESPEPPPELLEVVPPVVSPPPELLEVVPPVVSPPPLLDVVPPRELLDGGYIDGGFGVLFDEEPSCIQLLVFDEDLEDE